MIDCAFFGTEARFHHIGLAVKSIREVSPSSEVLVNKGEGVSFAFVRLHGITIELLEPLGGDSPIAGSQRKGVKLLHLCYEVPDLKAAVRLCRSAGSHRLGPPQPTPLDNRRIVWVFSKQYGLIELLEQQTRAASDPPANRRRALSGLQP